MRRVIILLLTVLVLAAPMVASAIEYMYTDTRGFRHFSCGSSGRGARVGIKSIGGERFHIISKPYAGYLHLPSDQIADQWCTGMMGAVRSICGLCSMPTSRGKVEDAKRKLGLEDAE